MDNDGIEPQLSSDAMKALQEFYQEQMASMRSDVLFGDTGKLSENETLKLEEDWQLSQFWYDEPTANFLAAEAIYVAGEYGRVACISCPTLYGRLRQRRPRTLTAYLFEFDQRFRAYGDDFFFYDYKDPLNVPSRLRNSFDVVVADPPFLSEECLKQTAQTVKLLAKDKIILCTGAVMEDLARQELNVHASQFIPKHARNLGNEFKCYANYNLDDRLKSM